MKRTGEIWLTVVMDGVLLTEGAKVTGQTLWVMEIQAHSDRTDASGGHRGNKNTSGLESYHYHCRGYPAHLHPNGVCPYTGGEKDTRTKTQTQTETQTQVQTQAQTQAQAAVQGISGAGGASDTSGWCRGGAQWNYICEDKTRLIGCWRQIDGVWYRFDDDGNIRTGRYRENGSLCYLGTDGKMAVGTRIIDKKGYRFDQDEKVIQPDNR